MLPNSVREALLRLNEAGFEAWLVGGCVRDRLMGAEPHDYDITTSAIPEETEAVFAGERIIETGLRHGTVTVLLSGEPLEITTFRTEAAYSDHRRPDAVRFTRSLREDLARRDFTVNAIAMAASATPSADRRIWKKRFCAPWVIPRPASGRTLCASCAARALPPCWALPSSRPRRRPWFAAGSFWPT